MTNDKTKPHGAELVFDYDENKMCSEASSKYGTGPINGAYKDGYVSGSRHQHSIDKAAHDKIVGELKEELQDLELIKCQMKECVYINPEDDIVIQVENMRMNIEKLTRQLEKARGALNSIVNDSRSYGLDSEKYCEISIKALSEPEQIAVMERKLSTAIQALNEINRKELNSQRPGGGYSESATLSYNALSVIKAIK